MRSFSRRWLCFSRTISCVSCGSHWKGVKGLGTNTDALHTTRSPFARSPLGTAKYASTTFFAKSAMPSKSSVVSVGSPIMKYSLTLLHPPWKASETLLIRSSSVTPLLMTSRRRCVPASGANVRLVFFSFCVASSESFSTLSRRSDGSEIDTCFSSKRRISSRINSARQV